MQANQQKKPTFAVLKPVGWDNAKYVRNCVFNLLKKFCSLLTLA